MGRCRGVIKGIRRQRDDDVNGKIFPAQKVQEFCVECLTKAGLSPDRSAIVAESLLCAEVRGIYSHGVVRLENYLQRVEAGVMKLEAPIATEMDAEAVALLERQQHLRPDRRPQGHDAGHRQGETLRHRCGGGQEFQPFRGCGLLRDDGAAGRHDRLRLHPLLPGHGRFRHQTAPDRHQSHRDRHPRRRPRIPSSWICRPPSSPAERSGMPP